MYIFSFLLLSVIKVPYSHRLSFVLAFLYLAMYLGTLSIQFTELFLPAAQDSTAWMDVSCVFYSAPTYGISGDFQCFVIRNNAEVNKLVPMCVSAPGTVSSR